METELYNNVYAIETIEVNQEEVKCLIVGKGIAILNPENLNDHTVSAVEELFAFGYIFEEKSGNNFREIFGKG